MLIFKNFKVSINNNLLIEPFNFKLKSGEKLYIIGENGSGKSSLLNEIIDPSTPNTIFYKTKDIFYTSIEQRSTIFSLFLQNYAIQTDIIVDEILELGDKKVSKLYSDFNLKKLNNRMVTSLSGGEKQKLFLYSLFSKESKFYLVDEPYNNIDINSYIKLNKFLSKFNNSLIITIHNLNHLKLTDAKIGVIFNKKISFFDTIEQFINSKIFVELYHGVEVEKKDNNYYFIY